MIVDIQDEILRLHSMGLLKHLLKDKTTRGNIIWATDAYNEERDRAGGDRSGGDRSGGDRSRDGGSADYGRDKEIRPELITGINSGVIKTRARKALEQQNARTRRRAEVFTPLWICESMTDYADRETRADAIQKYIDARYLEITCDEAPFLVSRYDASTGESIPIENRIGILDRKLRAVEKSASDEDKCAELIFRALKSVYGYELQGDNLLIARVNILMTFEEYFRRITRRRPTANEYRKAANIIAWNIWQMDGLTGAVPYRKAETNRQITLFDDEPPVILKQLSLIDDEDEPEQLSLLDDDEPPETKEPAVPGTPEPPKCRIYNWKKDGSVEFLKINEKGNKTMKIRFYYRQPAVSGGNSRHIR